jgi:hypothetical protein
MDEAGDIAPAAAMVMMIFYTNVGARAWSTRTPAVASSPAPSTGGCIMSRVASEELTSSAASV